MTAIALRLASTHLSPALFALYLVCNLHVQTITGIWIFIGWTALCFGVVLSGVSIGNRRIFYSLVALLSFHALAIPGSIIWGTGNWELTAGVVLWMAPALLLYLAKDARRVFDCLIPAWLLHSGLIIYQGLNNFHLDGDVMVRNGTPTGLANNANLAAGFLLLGIIYLLPGRFKWLSMPLLASLLFTGSRWGLMVMVALLVVMAITQAISWRPLAGAIAAMVMGVVLLGLFADSGYQVAGYGSFTAALNVAQTDIGVRLAVPHLPSFLPTGVAEHPGLHNVPLRIAVENGVLAAGLWVLITAIALIPRASEPKPQGTKGRARNYYPSKFLQIACIATQQNNVHRWLLLSLVLLSVLDYYTWMGHLGGFWWLLIGLLLKR